MKPTNLKGRKFNRWRVLRYAGKDKSGNTLWKCRCKCGTTRTIRAGHLTSGASKSCGCLRTEKMVKRSTKHGHARRGRHSAEYDIWVSMRARCNDRRNKSWSQYGGKGVRVCKRWEVFENFYADLGPRPKGTSLGRKNDAGDYRRGNVEWQTVAQQAAHRARLTVDGVTRSVAEWAKITGLRFQTIRRRRALGWKPLECVVGRIKQAKRAA